MIRPSDVALLAAVWRALDQHAGDEADAAWAVWDRIKAEPALRDAFLQHIEPVIDDTFELWIRAEDALRAAGGDPDSAQRALRERIDPRENPSTAERLESHDYMIIGGVFRDIMRMATEAWRREREGGTA